MTRRSRLLFVGRLAVQKNILVILKALDLYRKQFEGGLTLEIIGDGEEREPMLREIEKLGLGSMVNFRGEVHGDELQKAYESNGVFVLPTSYETFGNVYIEAMAKGMPIVTSDIDSVRNVVVNGRNGLLTRIEPVSVCQAIRRLIEDGSLYREIALNNLEDVKRYDWQSLVAKTLSVYDIVAHSQ